MSKILFSFLIFLSFCAGNKDSLNRRTAHLLQTQKNIQNSNFELLMFSDSNTPKLNEFLKNSKIRKVGFVGDGQFLDPKTKFTFSPARLDQELKRAYPNINETGIAYIDLESPYLEYLMNSETTSLEFKKSKKLFLDVLTYVKKARPKVKWGFYNIPFTTYWGKTTSFYDKDERVSEIIKNSDVLFPSIYIFYNKVNFILENEDYIKENTQQIIRIGEKYNKKVYPLVMSRYHPSSGNIAYETINETDFRFYLSTIKNTKYKEKSVDGIMYWNADAYFYKTNENKVVAEVQKSRMPFNTFYDNYLINTLSIFLEIK